MASNCTRGTFTLRRGQYLLFPGTILWWKEWRNERIKNKAFHAQISAPCDPCQRIFWVNQLPLEVIVLTCPGYKRSNRHVDLALIIINYERLSFVIPPRALTLITDDPCDGSLLVEAYDDESQIYWLKLRNYWYLIFSTHCLLQSFNYYICHNMNNGCLSSNYFYLLRTLASSHIFTRVVDIWWWNTAKFKRRRRKPGPSSPKQR